MSRVIGSAVVSLLVACASATASARAETPVVPRAGDACSSALAGAWTWNFEQAASGPFTQLLCEVVSRGDYEWRVSPSVSPIRKWLTLGYGNDGEIKSTLFSGLPDGDGKYSITYPSTWTGSPQAPDAQCLAEQSPSPGSYNATAVTGVTGQTVVVRLIPDLFNLRLSGYCLWQQASD